jgi:hypothetical protein
MSLSIGDGKELRTCSPTSKCARNSGAVWSSETTTRMATKAQFDFFSGMYNEHTDRRKNIQARAKFYFTIVSFYFGVDLLKTH